MPRCCPDGFTAVSFPPGLVASPLLHDDRYSSVCIPALIYHQHKCFHVPRKSSPQSHPIPSQTTPQTSQQRPQKTSSIRNEKPPPTTMTVIHIGKQPHQHQTPKPTLYSRKTRKKLTNKSSSNSAPKSPKPTKKPSQPPSKPSHTSLASKTTASSSEAPQSQTPRSAAKASTMPC